MKSVTLARSDFFYEKRWSFRKYESHNLPSANQKCHDRDQSHRRDFATEKQGVVRSDIGWSKASLELPFGREAMLYGRASLGIPPDVKQSADEWCCALGQMRENLSCIWVLVRSCEFAYVRARIWTGDTLARPLRAARITTIISLISLRSIGSRAANINRPLAFALHARLPRIDAQR